MHDYLEMWDIIQGVQPDLTDVPFTSRDVDLYVDGSSFIQATRCVGSMVFTGLKQAIGAQALPRGTSAQRAEIIAQLQAFRWTERKKKVNIYIGD